MYVGNEEASQSDEGEDSGLSDVENRSQQEEVDDATSSESDVDDKVWPHVQGC